MKFNSKTVSSFTFCLLLSSVIWEGCQTQTPTSSAIAQPSVDQYALVNINSTGPVVTAPNITGVTIGQNMIGNPSGGIVHAVSFSSPITVCSGPTPFQLVPSGFANYNETYAASPVVYNGPGCASLATVGFNANVIPTGLSESYDQYGLNITGYIHDPENPNYPPGPDNLDNMTFEVLPNGGSAYDVTPYQGIEFYINVGTNDSAVDRQFLVNTLEEIPFGAQGGNCGSPYDPTLNHCFDGFVYDYTNISRNQWVLVQKNWGDLKQYGFGSVTSPPTLTGANLQQVALFEWAELNTGQSVPVTISYTIAGIRFY